MYCLARNSNNYHSFLSFGCRCTKVKVGIRSAKGVCFGRKSERNKLELLCSSVAGSWRWHGPNERPYITNSLHNTISKDPQIDKDMMARERCRAIHLHDRLRWQGVAQNNVATSWEG